MFSWSSVLNVSIQILLHVNRVKMKFNQSNSIWLFILLVCQNDILATPTTEKLQTVVTDNSKNEETSSSKNRTIDKLVEQQTDLIKKIIAGHKITTLEYPIVTKKDVEVKDYQKLKQEKEQQSIEDLQKRCQLLFKLSIKNETTEKESIENETEANKIVTVQPFGPVMKPHFLQKTTQKPTISQKVDLVTEQTLQKVPTSYFFLTREPLTSQRPQTASTTQVPLPSSIKYVQLEPVILQKMVLNNGKMLYYWYRSIPTLLQYNKVKYQSQTQMEKAITQDHLKINEVTSEITPNYEVQYGAQQKDNNVYRQQMKFVIPMQHPKESSVEATQNPWNIDPYAYYPKTLQPTMVNIRMPYNPYFHMIKTLTLPENTVKSKNSK